MHFQDTAQTEMPMNIRNPRRFPRTVVLGVLALALAAGWIGRERVFANNAAELIKSGTVNVGDVKMTPHEDGGKVVGQAGIYFNGETAASSRFVTGRFVLEAGKSPHTPHTHLEEEVMMIESGHGIIVCDGKTTNVGPGSSMYTAPNISHGIVNTGDTPLVFYFVKWAPAGAK